MKHTSSATRRCCGSMKRKMIMQCKCGSETKLNEAVKGKLGARLEYQVCKACGRVSNAELFVRGLSVAEDTGAQATSRLLFDKLDSEKEKRLYDLSGNFEGDYL